MQGGLEPPRHTDERQGTARLVRQVILQCAVNSMQGKKRNLAKQGKTLFNFSIIIGLEFPEKTKRLWLVVHTTSL